MRKATLDQLNDALDTELVRGEKEMDVIGHCDKRMQLVMTQSTIMLKYVQ